MDRLPHFPSGRVKQRGQGGLGNQIRHMAADHMDAENVVAVRIRDDLHEPAGFTVYKGFSNSLKRKLSDLQPQPLLPGFVLGPTELAVSGRVYTHLGTRCGL